MIIKIIDDLSNEIEIDVINYAQIPDGKIHINYLNACWDNIREQRKAIFNQTQWLRERHIDEKSCGVPTTLSDTKFKEWLNYWQELRDITTVFTNPFDVVFPNMPSNSSNDSIEFVQQNNQRTFGVIQAKLIVDLIGERNLELIKQGQTVDNASLLSTLGSIKALMETGALKKARDLTIYYRPSFSLYDSIFLKNINDINNYLNKMGY